MGDVVMQRGFKPWLQPDFLFHLSPLENVQRKCLEILHNMTNSVIQSRKRQYLQSKKDGPAKEDSEDIGKHISTDKMLLAAIISKPNNRVTQNTQNRIRKTFFPTQSSAMSPKECVHHATRKYSE
jgi:hypothetical protein